MSHGVTAKGTQAVTQRKCSCSPHPLPSGIPKGAFTNAGVLEPAPEISLGSGRAGLILAFSFPGVSNMLPGPMIL